MTPVVRVLTFIPSYVPARFDFGAVQNAEELDKTAQNLRAWGDNIVSAVNVGGDTK